MERVCNFAIIRFAPYRETGEIVNVGILLYCEEIGYLDFKLEMRRWKRVTDFFPELDHQVYNQGLKALHTELDRVTDLWDSRRHSSGLGTGAGPRKQHLKVVFSELVRAREALFACGPVGTVLTEDPKAKLKQLFEHYVQRLFAVEREYHEDLMRKRLDQLLTANHLDAYYQKNRRLGNDNYHVTIPFVHYAPGSNEACKAIKPLHLAKKTASEIYQHGDDWVARVRRLREMNCLPRDLLFAVKVPRGQTREAQAADEITAALRHLEAQTLPFTDDAQILRFARVGVSQQP